MILSFFCESILKIRLLDCSPIRIYCCSQCGYQVTRDHNAAQNILALGLDGLGAIPRSLRL
jgi:transposase